MFLSQREMKAISIIDREESKDATVDWGVPQLIVLGPFFSCHINDQPD